MRPLSWCGWRASGFLTTLLILSTGRSSEIRHEARETREVGSTDNDGDSFLSLVVHTDGHGHPLVWPKQQELTFCVVEPEGMFRTSQSDVNSVAPLFHDVRGWEQHRTAQYLGAPKRHIQSRYFRRALSLSLGILPSMCGVTLREVDSDMCLPPSTHTSLDDPVPEGKERVWFTIHVTDPMDRVLSDRQGDAPVAGVLRSWLSGKWGVPLTDPLRVSKSPQYNDDMDSGGSAGDMAETVVGRGGFAWKVRSKGSSSDSRARNASTVESVPKWELEDSKISVVAGLPFPMLLRTLLHEMGHAIGFAHETANEGYQPEDSPADEHASGRPPSADISTSSTEYRAQMPFRFTQYDPLSFMGYGPSNYLPSKLDALGASSVFGQAVSIGSEVTVTYVPATTLARDSSSVFGTGGGGVGRTGVVHANATILPAEFTFLSLLVTVSENLQHRRTASADSAGVTTLATAEDLPTLLDRVHITHLCHMLRTPGYRSKDIEKVILDLYQAFASNGQALSSVFQEECSCGAPCRCEFVGVDVSLFTMDDVDGDGDNDGATTCEGGAGEQGRDKWRKSSVLMCGQPLQAIATLSHSDRAVEIHSPQEQGEGGFSIPLAFLEEVEEKTGTEEEKNDMKKQKTQKTLCLRSLVRSEGFADYNVEVSGALQVIRKEGRGSGAADRLALRWNEEGKSLYADAGSSVKRGEVERVKAELERIRDQHQTIANGTNGAANAIGSEPQSLLISRTYIHNPQELIDSLPFLKTVEASDVGMESLSLKYARDLVRASLDRNRLRTIVVDPTVNTQLVHLDLSWNKLEEVPSLVFSLPRLRLLNLANNKITALPSSVSANDAGLESSTITQLDLSGNFLKSLPANMLRSAFPALLVLKVHDNHISRLEFDHCTGINGTRHPLKELGVSRNLLLSFPALGVGCVENLSVLEASSNSMTGVLNITRHFPSLTSLSVVSAGLTAVTATTFSNTPRLEFLDLSANDIWFLPKQIGSLDKLRALYVDNNLLSHFPTSMSDMRLHTLSANGNQLTHYAASKEIEALYLSFNNITSIDLTNAFLTLRELNLPHNGLSGSIDLSKAVAINDIDVSHNRLSDLQLFNVSGEFGRSLRRFRRIWAKHNVMEGVYLQYPMMAQSVDFSFNSIVTVSIIGGTLRSKIKIRDLDLSHNRLQSSTFGYSLVVSSLDLSHNAFTAVPDNHLRISNALSLSHNLIQGVDLSDAMFLADLDLSFNNISHIGFSVFMRRPTASRLILVGNPLHKSSVIADGFNLAVDFSCDISGTPLSDELGLVGRTPDLYAFAHFVADTDAAKQTRGPLKIKLFTRDGVAPALASYNNTRDLVLIGPAIPLPVQQPFTPAVSADQLDIGHIRHDESMDYFNSLGRIRPWENAENLLQPLIDDKTQPVLTELKAYFLDSFGNATRIDYGTGHETNFFAFLCCLRQLKVLHREDDTAIVFHVFTRYLDVVRNLQTTYRMEPAGSHGVWGLDDYQFLPFLFGSSQLMDQKRIKPSLITSIDHVHAYANEYLYFAAIKFIHEVKRGPFAEHSPMLYDISAVKTWDKVNSGLRKMYEAEVLRKFPIMQHFVFGTILPFE